MNSESYIPSGGSATAAPTPNPVNDNQSVYTSLNSRGSTANTNGLLSTTEENKGAKEKAPMKTTNAQQLAIEYARLQGYLEGYLDQLSASKEAQEELISKLLGEIGELMSASKKD